MYTVIRPDDKVITGHNSSELILPVQSLESIYFFREERKKKKKQFSNQKLANHKADSFSCYSMSRDLQNMKKLQNMFYDSS